MKPIIQISLVVGVFFINSQSTFSQVTTVDREVQIQQLIRDVSISIPSSYSPQSPIPLIVSLHGFGMTASGLESYLKSYAEQEQWMIVNIDGAGNRHDDQLNGQEINVINSTLDSMATWYSIDTNQVLLFGFSYGGRESLYFGSQNPGLFDGIITHSAAMQSTADVNNQLPVPWPNPFQYENMNQIPICNCMGSNDQSFGPFILQFQEQLETVSSNDTLIVKNGVGHNIYYGEFFTDLDDCIGFIRRQNQLNTSVDDMNFKERGDVFFPNPSSGKLYFKKRVEIINVVDLTGKSVHFDYDLNAISIKGKAGFYLIVYEYQNVLKIQKIIIR